MPPSKTKTPHPIDQARRALGAAALSMLAELPYGEITIEAIIERAGVEAELAHRLYQDRLDMVATGLCHFDRDLTEQLAKDLADDADASVREKIFEALLQRFEAYRAHKPALEALHRAARSNPRIALMLADCLTRAMRQILGAVGGGGQGLGGLMRAKGLAGVYLVVMKDWLNDDSPDLALTARCLDQRLNTATQLAATFGLIRERGGAGDDD